MRITDFDIYHDLLKEKSGFVLTPDQSYLLDSRLAPIAKKWGYSSMEAMTAALHGVPDGKLVDEVIEAITDKSTWFFRDGWPFETVREEIFPALKNLRTANRKIKIWCAAASTGQEAYSLAMMIRNKDTKLSGWKTEILATDLSTRCLKRAAQGIYTQMETQHGLAVRTLLKYFKQVDNENWQVGGDIRKMVRLHSFNLLDNMAALGKFDLILCRNVLGGFDASTRRRTLDRLAGQLEPDGFLILGRGESAESDSIRPFHEKRGIYVHKDSVHQPAQPSAKLAKSGN